MEPIFKTKVSNAHALNRMDRYKYRLLLRQPRRDDGSIPGGQECPTGLSLGESQLCDDIFWDW